MGSSFVSGTAAGMVSSNASELIKNAEIFVHDSKIETSAF